MEFELRPPTGDIGLLKVVGESGIAAGVRRIEALTGAGALSHLRQQERALERVAELLKAPVGEVPARLEKLLDEEEEIARRTHGGSEAPHFRGED